MKDGLKDMEERFGQIIALIWVFLSKIKALNLSIAQIQELMKNKDHPFWKAFDEATKILVPQPLAVVQSDEPDNTESQIDFWVYFYEKYFNIKLNRTDLKIPDRREGFNWLVIVARGVRLNDVWTVCKGHFQCWNYANNTDDLESLMQESERGVIQVTSVFWFRDRCEADKEMQDLSANDQTKPSISLIARCLLELKYFNETGKKLDLYHYTLCAGSRYANGTVPVVNSHQKFGSFNVGWIKPYSSDLSLRSRVAVGG